MKDIEERASDKLNEESNRADITDTESFSEAKDVVEEKHEIIRDLTLDENGELVDVDTLEENLNDYGLTIFQGRVCTDSADALVHGVGNEALDLVEQDMHPSVWLKDVDQEAEERVRINFGVKSIRETD